MAVNIAAMTAFARKVVAGNTGYNQARRWAFYDRATDRFIPNKATDCSAFAGAIARAGTKKVNLGTDHAGFYTGNIESKLVGTGEFTAMAYPGGGAVREGDILWKPGHVVYAVSPTQIAEAYIDERGGISGGQDGNQTGQETRIVGNYGGWTRLIRPKTTTSTTPNGGFLMALSDAEQKKLAERVKNIQDILTGYSENQYVKKGYSLPLISMRVRDIKDYISGNGPQGKADTLLRKIAKKLGL